MNIQRRQFLKQSALGVGGVLVGVPLSRSEPATSKFFDPFAPVPLGRSGLKFSRICMGTGMRGGNRQSNQTRLGREAFQRLLRDAHDRGVSTFDLADLYGSHAYLPPALDGLARDRYQLISKIWWNTGGLPEPERPAAAGRAAAAVRWPIPASSKILARSRWRRFAKKPGSFFPLAPMGRAASATWRT